MKLIRSVHEYPFFDMSDEDFSQFEDYEIVLKDVKGTLDRDSKARLQKVRVFHTQPRIEGSGMDLATPDPEYRAEVRDTVMSTILLARDVGVGKLILHLGKHFPLDEPYKERVDSAVGVLKEAMQETGVYDTNADVRVCVENDDMFGPELTHINTLMKGADAFKYVMEALEGNAGVCVDIEHAMRYGLRRNFQEKYLQKGKHIKVDRKQTRAQNDELEALLAEADAEIAEAWKTDPEMLASQRAAVKELVEGGLSVEHLHLCQTLWDNDFYGGRPTPGAHYPLSSNDGPKKDWLMDIVKYMVVTGAKNGCKTASFEYDPRPDKYDHCKMCAADRDLVQGMLDS